MSEQPQGFHFANAQIGTISTRADLSDGDVSEFWMKVDKNGPLPDQEKPWYQGLGPCWTWKGSLDMYGYGRIQLRNRGIKSHRLSWIVHQGFIPNGMQVLHSCDNRSCVNPDHLKVGTNQDNVDDMNSRKRAVVRSGDAHYMRLNPSKVRWNGPDNPSIKNPEKTPRGNAHYTRRCPEKRPVGAKNGAAKLSESDVLAIRKAFSDGVSKGRLALDFKVSKSNIHLIVTRRNWSHLK